MPFGEEEFFGYFPLIDLFIACRCFKYLFPHFFCILPIAPCEKLQKNTHHFEDSWKKKPIDRLRRTVYYISDVFLWRRLSLIQ